MEMKKRKKVSFGKSKKGSENTIDTVGSFSDSITGTMSIISFLCFIRQLSLCRGDCGRGMDSVC